jgi:phospholipid/cholesterol/gamma-HCH transport system ATP-binding protein
VIEVRGLRKRLGRKQVLDGLDLEVHKGETLVILGPSGTGKSVLLKHIIGLMDPDEGDILIDGENVTRFKESEWNRVRQRFGMLFQGAALFDSMTVGENVALPILEHERKADPNDVRRRVAERLEWVGLKGIEAQKPASLSGGMRKRVGLARALALGPEVILYDEPTTGLDPITSDTINELIREMQANLHVTSIVVTHDIKSAFTVADRMVLLYGGKVVYEGKPDEVRSTKDPMMHQFLEGSSKGPIQPV